ncbi:MAG: type IX secretion system outer membrane channel protein PorV [Cyclobacteriaceae bacterium]
MNQVLSKALVFAAGFLPFTLLGQGSNAAYISGQDTTRNPITVAVPFLSFAPDSRGSALGDAGVASSPDVYSVHWNNAKLAFIEDDMGFSFSYSPWLGKIVDDMSLNYLTFYKKIDRIQAIGVTMRYFDLGEIQLTDATGEPQGLENPREAAIDATYSRKLTETMGIGGTIRFVWSNLAGNLTGAPDASAGTSVAIDVGYYFNKPIIFSGKDSEVSFGAHISNFGQKITYSSESNEDFIPANLRIGGGFKTKIDPYNSLTFLLDFNKLLVPTPPVYQVDDLGNFVEDPATGDPVILRGKDPSRPLLSGAFGSFADAPGTAGGGGVFVEEMREIMISVGTEYLYKDVFAVRAGYFYESEKKGSRKYFTAGLGFKYQVFGVDFSYLVPSENDHPLAETLRLSFKFNLDKATETAN